MASEKTPLIENRGKTTRSCWSKIILFLSFFHLEPYIFLVILCYAIEGVFFTQLVQDKLCAINYEYSEEICDNIGNGNHTEEMNRVQKASADIIMFKDFIINFPNLFFVMIMGPWSDRHGRKLSLLLPALGSVLGSGLAFGCAYYPVRAEYMLLSVVPQGILGSSMSSKMMGVWAHTSDVTSKKAKMFRMTLVELSLSVSVPAGLYLGNIIFDDLYGYLGIYGVIASLCSLSMVYIGLRVKNVKRNSSDSTLNKSETGCSTTLLRIKEPISVFFKKREGNGRLILLSHATVLTTAVVSFCFLNFNYLYSQKLFNWDYHSFTTWNMICMPIITVGSALLLSIMSYFLHVSDSVIGFIGALSKMGSFIVLALATQPWHLYLSSLVGLGGGMILVSSRAALAKLLPQTETGSVFALLAVGEGILPLASMPVLTAIYNYSLTFYPGLIYFIGVGITCVTAMCFIVAIIAQRSAKSSRIQQKTSPDEYKAKIDAANYIT
ncbi:putative peptidoglycan muropeptide transporter SLC46 [Oratosquilla oratoria]|uniref:putative peptidoglycan muropeptide transporter SLC46 n=1 Tax=Oratosquilla oratoria TaxID=337810 RepID=UPI003F767122